MTDERHIADISVDLSKLVTRLVEQINAWRSSWQAEYDSILHIRVCYPVTDADIGRDHRLVLL